VASSPASPCYVGTRLVGGVPRAGPVRRAAAPGQGGQRRLSGLGRATARLIGEYCRRPHRQFPLDRRCTSPSSAAPTRPRIQACSQTSGACRDPTGLRTSGIRRSTRKSHDGIPRRSLGNGLRHPGARARSSESGVGCAGPVLIKGGLPYEHDSSLPPTSGPLAAIVPDRTQAVGE